MVWRNVLEHMHRKNSKIHWCIILCLFTMIFHNQKFPRDIIRISFFCFQVQGPKNVIMQGEVKMTNFFFGIFSSDRSKKLPFSKHTEYKGQNFISFQILELISRAIPALKEYAFCTWKIKISLSDVYYPMYTMEFQISRKHPMKNDWLKYYLWTIKVACFNTLNSKDDLI